jgi:hypothetical protein
MAQIFTRTTNTIARATLACAFLCLCAGGWLVHALYWSSYNTRAGIPREQPVPFSHQHHVAGLGIDCRYCHVSVESTAFAGMPSTETCMSCHSQVWTDAPPLEPVRRSFARNEPLRWTRVHDLPDFTFFDHSIHLSKGIGCATCHGPVDQMPLLWQEHTLFMKWCLDCHREPERFIRPQEELFNLAWQPPANQLDQGRDLLERHHVNTAQLADCSICHR